MDRDSLSSAPKYSADNYWLRVRARWFALIFLLLLPGLSITGITRANTKFDRKFKDLSFFQNSRKGVIPSSRGRILDCKERPIADNKVVFSLFVNSYLVPDDQRANLAQALTDKLGIDPNVSKQAVNNIFSSRQILIEEMSLEDLQRFNSLPRRGPVASLMRQVGVIPRELRCYPMGPLASPVIGFTGFRDEGQIGLWGIEYDYDDVLSGRPGVYKDKRDQRGQRIPFSREEVISPRYGTDLILTLDVDVQALAESVLSAGILESGALGGAMVVTEPSTGNVLALASLPAFESSNYHESWHDESAKFSRATCLSYEAGSVMKIFTAAAALEEKIISPESSFYVTKGPLKFRGGVVPDHVYPKADYVDLEYTVVHSCNRAAALMAVNLGRERMTNWLQRFGFGSVTNLDLPGEPSGNLKESHKVLSEIDVANMGFGHGITVTPLQIAQGIGVFANNGVLVPLRLVKARRDPGSSENKPIEYPGPVQILSPSTAETIQRFMTGVVEKGTATPARSPWTAAGKTGTSHKINPAGGYEAKKFISTFAGYGPIPNPKWVIVVILDEPKWPYFGGTACGPVFRKMFTSLMIREGIHPARKLNEKDTSKQSKSENSPSDFLAKADNSSSDDFIEEGEYILTPDPFSND